MSYEYTNSPNQKRPFLRRKGLLYPDLSYRIIGTLFDVWNELGYGYQEKYYQKATARALNKHGIDFQEQVPAVIQYNDEKIGTYFLDFLIEKEIVLEIKRGEHFSKSNIQQVYGYLRALNLQLGILANFTSRGVQSKRIVNIV